MPSTKVVDGARKKVNMALTKSMLWRQSGYMGQPGIIFLKHHLEIMGSSCILRAAAFYFTLSNMAVGVKAAM